MAYSWGYVIPPDVYGLLVDFGYGSGWTMGSDGNYYASSLTAEEQALLEDFGFMPNLVQISSNLWTGGG